jgi:hypothetical protein
LTSTFEPPARARGTAHQFAATANTVKDALKILYDRQYAKARKLRPADAILAPPLSDSKLSQTKF